MGVFDEEVALALELISENGQSVILRGYREPLPQPKPWRPIEAEPDVADDQSDQTVTMVFLDEENNNEGHKVKALLAASGLAAPPTKLSSVVRGAETWRVVGVKPLAPNEQTILYELHLKK